MHNCCRENLQMSIFFCIFARKFNATPTLKLLTHMKTFLKVLTLMVVLAWATGICAQDVTARAEIRVSSPTGSTDVLQLLEISSATADFDNGWDSEKILDNTTFSIYALAGGTPVSTYATNDLNNTALVFQTSEEKANYEFSFLIKVL